MGNARFHAPFQFDLHSFDQNISSQFREQFILNQKKRLIRSWIFRYFFFALYI